MKIFTFPFLLLIFGSCGETPVAVKTNPVVKSPSKPDQVHDSVLPPDSAAKGKHTPTPVTQKFFYPNMSHCGGGLYGIYSKGELIRIESTFSSELGYSSKNVDLKNSRVVKIAYREHFAEWEKYTEKYPNNDDFDPTKMTYSDTLYIWETESGKSLKKYSGKRLIGTTVNEELVDRLFDCIDTMKKELASEKILVNK